LDKTKIPRSCTQVKTFQVNDPGALANVPFTPVKEDPTGKAGMQLRAGSTAAPVLA